MTLNTAIQRANELRLNTLTDEQKAAWVWDLDNQMGEMMKIPPRPNPWPEFRDVELLMPAPHEEIYPLYLVCKIDYYNQEMGLYSNDRAIYDAAMREARAWWRRHHRPRRNRNWKVW